MIITVKLINISPYIVIIFFLVKRNLLKSIARKFSVLNTVLLTTVSILYSRPLDLFILYNCNFMF